MAIEAGDIRWNIGADLAGFKKGIAEATASAKGLGKNFLKHSKQIGIAFTAIGGAITAGIGGSVKVFAEAGDEIQKMAARTGFATETLSEFKFAAERSGSSLQSIEKATKKMSTVIFEAGEEVRKAAEKNLDASEATGTYTDALRALGLTYADLEGLTPEAQFLKLSEALAGVEDQTKKTALASELFGRAGTELIPMFSEGAEGLEQLRQRARDLGIVFDQDAANAAAQFQDSMLDLKESMKSLMFVVAQVVLPHLDKFINFATNAIKSVRDFSNAHPALFSNMTMVASAIGALMLVLGPLIIALPGLVSAFGLLSGGFVTAGAAATGASVGVTGLAASFAALAIPIAAATAVIGGTAIAIGMVLDQYRRLRIEQEAKRQSDVAVSEGINNLIQAYAREGIMIDRARLAGKSHNEQIQEINRQKIEAKMATGEYGEALGEATKVTGDATKGSADLTKETFNATGAQIQMKNASGSVKNSLNRLKKPLQDTSDYYWDVADAATAAANAMQAAGGSGGGGGGAVPRATGGVVNEGLTLVGERGPELAHFPKGTRIMTNADTKRAVSDGVSGSSSSGLSMDNMQITINASGSSDPRVLYNLFKTQLYKDMSASWNKTGR